MDDLVEVSLLGGPQSLPRTFRVERSRIRDGVLKIEYLGGYEHFERADEAPDAGGSSAFPTFQWTLRTKIAE